MVQKRDNNDLFIDPCFPLLDVSAVLPGVSQC